MNIVNDFKRISPAWAAVALTMVGMMFGAVMFVRAQDVKQVDRNTEDIATIRIQVSALIQSQQDLTTTLRDYLKYQKGGQP